MPDEPSLIVPRSGSVVHEPFGEPDDAELEALATGVAVRAVSVIDAAATDVHDDRG